MLDYVYSQVINILPPNWNLSMTFIKLYHGTFDIGKLLDIVDFCMQVNLVLIYW